MWMICFIKKGFRDYHFCGPEFWFINKLERVIVPLESRNLVRRAHRVPNKSYLLQMELDYLEYIYEHQQLSR